MPTDHQHAQGGRADDRREREEMFAIAPQILAGGALPRRNDGAAILSDRDRTPRRPSQHKRPR